MLNIIIYSENKEKEKLKSKNKLLARYVDWRAHTKEFKDLISYSYEIINSIEVSSEQKFDPFDP